jgi:hypothetical protein
MRQPVIRGLIGLVVGLAILGAGRAEAYPQFQISRDPTCSGCHLSPSGGGLLNENGRSVAEQLSQFGTAPETMYGVLPLPDWLQLGGDFRGATGYFKNPDDAFTLFPMQAELYARLAYRGFSLYLNGGIRPPQWISLGVTPGVIERLWSREHYVMWQQNPDAGEGLYARAGRFMPVFGLRFVEHPTYTRRHGGTPLYSETYAAAVEYVTPAWEAHVTGFIEDPLLDPAARDDGAAAYGEARLDPELAVGGGAMLAVNDGLSTIRVAATGKVYLSSLDTLVQAELQFVHRQLTGSDTANQLVGYVMGSRPFGDALLLDVGLGHHDQNLAIQGVDRDAVDVNLHWFVTSHLELVLHNRIEGIGVGSSRGGPTSGWALLHAHYRL